MYSTFSRKSTFYVITTLLGKNTLFSALPRTAANLPDKRLVLFIGPSHPSISSSLSFSHPLDVYSKFRNSCVSIFFGFLSAKLLYNTCNEFRSYLVATSQLLKRSLAPRSRHEYHLPVTNVLSYIRAVAIVRIQNFIAIFPNPLQIINQITFDPPLSSTEVHLNNSINNNNNDNNSITSLNDGLKAGDTIQTKPSLSSILSYYLPRISNPLFNSEKKDPRLPRFNPIPLPNHTHIPSPVTSQKEGSINPCDTRDTTLLLNTLRKEADNGSRIASFNLGMMYAKGTAVQQDNQQACNYFKTGSHLGDKSSLFMLFLVKSKLRLSLHNTRVLK